MTETEEISNRTENIGFLNSLEGRLSGLGFLGFSSGFFAYTTIVNLNRGDYDFATWAALGSIGCAVDAVFEGRRISEKYGKK